MSQLERERFIGTYTYVARTEPYRTRFWDLIRLHTDNFFNGIHGGAVFLPWHRWYILQLENLLREVDCRVTLPYWDWTKEAANPFQSIIWSNDPSWLGGNGDDTQGSCIVTGPFVAPGYQVEAPQGVNNAGGCITRNFVNGSTFATPADIQLLYNLYPGPSPSDYSAFEENCESGPGMHGAVHCAIGGTMCSTGASGNPEFFLHHANIDKIWHDWQASQPNDANMFAYNGNLDAQMPATPPPYNPATPRTVMDYRNQTTLNGSVSICYQQPQSFSWLNAALQPLTNNKLVQLSRTPASSAVPFLKIMNAPLDRIQAAQQQLDVRNGITPGSPYTIITQAQAIELNSHTSVLGVVLTQTVISGAFSTQQKTGILQPTCGGYVYHCVYVINERQAMFH
jgi:hypothetical protein